MAQALRNQLLTPYVKLSCLTLHSIYCISAIRRHIEHVCGTERSFMSIAGGLRCALSGVSERNDAAMRIYSRA